MINKEFLTTQFETLKQNPEGEFNGPLVFGEGKRVHLSKTGKEFARNLFESLNSQSDLGDLRAEVKVAFQESADKEQRLVLRSVLARIDSSLRKEFVDPNGERTMTFGEILQDAKGYSIEEIITRRKERALVREEERLAKIEAVQTEIQTFGAKPVAEKSFEAAEEVKETPNFWQKVRNGARGWYGRAGRIASAAVAIGAMLFVREARATDIQAAREAAKSRGGNSLRIPMPDYFKNLPNLVGNEGEEILPLVSDVAESQAVAGPLATVEASKEQNVLPKQEAVVFEAPKPEISWTIGDKVTFSGSAFGGQEIELQTVTPEPNGHFTLDGVAIAGRGDVVFIHNGSFEINGKVVPRPGGFLEHFAGPGTKMTIDVDGQEKTLAFVDSFITNEPITGDKEQLRTLGKKSGIEIDDEATVFVTCTNWNPETKKFTAWRIMAFEPKSNSDLANAIDFGRNG